MSSSADMALFKQRANQCRSNHYIRFSLCNLGLDNVSDVGNYMGRLYA